MNIAMFTDKITTRKDISTFVSLGEEFSKLLYDTHSDFQQKLDHVFPEQWNMAVQEFLKEQEIDTADPSKVEKILLDLKDQLLALPNIMIELAIDPTPEMVDIIRKTFLELKMPVSIIDIKVNPSIIGGMCITGNGIYKDYSVKRYVEEFKDKVQLMSNNEQAVR